jgi:hypothetical protein
MERGNGDRDTRKPVRFEKRFMVIERSTGKELHSAFVLFPEFDSAARIALASYAQATRNGKVARYINNLLDEIKHARVKHAHEAEVACGNRV